MFSSFRKNSIIGLLIFFIIIIWLTLIGLRVFYAPLLLRGQTTSITLSKGGDSHELAFRLEKKQLLKYPRFFIWMTELTGKAKQLRFGEYKLIPGMSLSDLLDNMTKGRGLVQHKIVFIEGWTFKRMMKRIRHDANLTHVLSGKSVKNIMKTLNIPYSHPEGLFFPSTYLFVWKSRDIDILKKSYQKMQQVLKAEWQHRAKDLPYQNSYQALIVASMVEKEASLLRERPMVAGVILRRLKKGMRLQIDPTILYGLGKPYGSTITRQDLKTKTPYNTYQIKGLPPTPIDMPSRSSIHAALHPDHSKYLYYVSKGDGSHEFSVTYKAHLRAIRRYLLDKPARQKDAAAEMIEQYYWGKIRKINWAKWVSVILSA